MTFLEIINPLYSLSGMGVGILVGMTGVGGGSLMTPLLIILFGIHPATAVGTDLLYAAATKTSGTLYHGFARTVDWRVVGRLAAGSVPAAALTIFALSRIDIKGSSVQEIVTAVLGVALFATAISLIFRDRLLEAYAHRLHAMSPRRTLVLTVAVGATIGVLVSITSVGAGALGVTALLALYPRLPITRVVGSDIAHAVPLTLVAGMGHWMLGSIDWSLLVSLLVGSIPGILIGSYFAGRVPNHLLRLILAATLLLVGTRLLM
jgi:uncharacterized protein